MPPPLVEATKLTGVPAQMLLPGVAATVMVGVTLLDTFIVIPLDVAVEVLAHPAFDVNTQVTTSPKARVLGLNKVEFVPALIPFTFH